MSQENVEIIRKLFEGVNRSGIEGMVEFFDPEIEWHTDPRVPEPGVYKGVDNVARYLQGLFDVWGHVRHEVKRIDPVSDETNFAQITAHTTTRGSKEEVMLDWCFIGTLRDGKVVRIRSFLSREDALEAAGLSE